MTERKLPTKSEAWLAKAVHDVRSSSHRNQRRRRVRSVAIERHHLLESAHS